MRPGREPAPGGAIVVMAPILGYCLNLFRASTLEELLAALSHLPPGIGAGLWINAPLAQQLERPEALERLIEALQAGQLTPYSLNAFPYDDFHGPVVKHRVYHPAWDRPERLEYTLRVAELLARLLPEGAEGGLSTLPVGWPGQVDPHLARHNLRQAAEGLRQLEDRTGHRIHLDLEPEPGCLLSTSTDLVEFWGDLDRQYLRVCHDVCHAAVMAEDQGEVLGRYRQAGLLVGKVQLSAALLVPDTSHPEARRLLERLSHDRYLHQCLYQKTRFFSDLPEFLPQDLPGGELRIHFHAPLCLAELGPGVLTTRDQIEPCLAALGPEVQHLEVETYTLPSLVARPEQVLRQELEWFQHVFKPVG